MGVSIPTLIRMEQGDPGVGMGIYTAALWMIGRAAALPELASPSHDLGALETDVREALKRKPVRSPAAIGGRLRRKKRS